MDGISTSNSAIETATAWLGEFGAALALGKASRIDRLFASDCHWRDILALTWNLRTISGADGIANVMASALKRMSPRQLAVAVDRTPPRYVSRAGVEAMEANQPRSGGHQTGAASEQAAGGRSARPRAVIVGFD